VLHKCIIIFPLVTQKTPKHLAHTNMYINGELLHSVYVEFRFLQAESSLM